jgi:hypothetical protein
MRVYLGLAMAAVLCIAGSARAEPLNLNQVAEDSKWVAHLDVDAMRTSSVVQKAHEMIKKNHPEAVQHLARVREMWKFNPCTDLHGITICGSQLKRHTGVAIVHAKVDQQVVLEKAKQAPEHRVSTYGSHELHTWIHAKGTKMERAMTGTLYKPDVLVFGGSTADVMAALDVLDGKKPSLAGKSSPLAGPVSPGTIFTARAVGLADADLPCKSPLVKQIESLSLAIGENQNESFIESKIAAKQADVAEQLKSVIEGGRAMALLMHGDDAEAAKLLNAVKVTAADKVVSVDWKAPADAVWAHVQKMKEIIKKKGWPPHGVPFHHP